MSLNRLWAAVVTVVVAGAGLTGAVTSAVADPVPAPTVLPALPPGGSFVPVTPTRVLDTRTAGGPGTVTTAPAGAGLPGIDLATVAAVLVNVTVVNASGAGYVTVGGAVGTSNGNYVKGAPSATLSLVRVRAGGTVAITTSATADVVVDVEGYVTTPQAATAASFTPLAAPKRIADTRSAAGLTPFPAGTTQYLDVVGRTGIPSDATGVIANVTIAGATASTYVTAWSGVGARPVVSSVNASRGDIVANRTVLPLDAAGRAALFNAGGTTNVVVDVVGYLSPDPHGSYFTPTPAARLLDATGTAAAVTTTVDPDPHTNVVLAPSVVDLAPTTAVWLTVVGDHPAGRGYVTTRPADVAPVATSDLDVVPGRAVANAGPVRVSGVDGAVQVSSSARSRLVADLSGWFRKAPGPASAGLWSTTRYPDYTDLPTRTDTQLLAAGELPAYFADGVFAARATRTMTNAYAVAPDTTVQEATFDATEPSRVERWNPVSRVGQLTGITQLATAGDAFAAAVYALDVLGQVWGFQSNVDGELGTTPSGFITYPLGPKRVPLPAGVVATAVYAAQGIGYAVGLDGTVSSWGRAGTGQLGRTPTATPWVPAAVPGLSAPTAIAGDDRVTFAIDGDGGTLQWGTPVGGTTQAAPAVTDAACGTAVALHADFNGVWELCDDGTVVQLSRLGAVSATARTLAVTGVTAIGAGAGYDNGIRALLADGRVADVPTTGPARYEGGFADVTAVNGSPGVQITYVDPQ